MRRSHVSPVLQSELMTRSFSPACRVSVDCCKAKSLAIIAVMTEARLAHDEVWRSDVASAWLWLDVNFIFQTLVIPCDDWLQTLVTKSMVKAFEESILRQTQP